MRHKLLLLIVLFLSYIPYIIFGLLVFLGYVPVWDIEWFSFVLFGDTITVVINAFYIPYLASTSIGLIGGFMVWCFAEPCEDPLLPFLEDGVEKGAIRVKIS